MVKLPKHRQRLNEACRSGDLESAVKFIEKGADPLGDKSGMTPLLTAMKLCRRNIIDFSVGKIIDPYNFREGGYEWGNLEAIKEFFSKDNIAFSSKEDAPFSDLLALISAKKGDETQKSYTTLLKEISLDMVRSEAKEGSGSGNENSPKDDVLERVRINLHVKKPARTWFGSNKNTAQPKPFLTLNFVYKSGRVVKVADESNKAIERGFSGEYVAEGEKLSPGQRVARDLGKFRATVDNYLNKDIPKWIGALEAKKNEMGVGLVGGYSLSYSSDESS